MQLLKNSKAKDEGRGAICFFSEDSLRGGGTEASEAQVKRDTKGGGEGVTIQQSSESRTHQERSWLVREMSFGV